MASLYKDIKEKDLNICLKTSDTISIILNDDLNINYDLNDGDYSILIFNNANKNIVLNENGIINNSNVTINILELNEYEFKQESNIKVNKGSHLKVLTTYLGVNKKDINYHLFNNESESTIEIDNNVVCLKDADLSLNVVGKIVKGAKRSKCFQKSRCLTFENPKKAKVLPVLEIDENDVEASHSLSSGTIDEEVLFYMNSRGLNKKQALLLLIVSYLMPNEDFYKEYEDGLLIKKIADERVSKACLI